MGCAITKGLRRKIGSFEVENTKTQTLENKCLGMENTYHLYDAIKRNDFTEARSLISNGTDANCMNYLGGTPLIEVCRGRKSVRRRSRRASFVNFLIQHGADTDHTDIHGLNALLYAEVNRHDSVVDILTNHDTSKIIQSKGDETGDWVLQCSRSSLLSFTAPQNNCEPKFRNLSSSLSYTEQQNYEPKHRNLSSSDSYTTSQNNYEPRSRTLSFSFSYSAPQNNYEPKQRKLSSSLLHSAPQNNFGPKCRTLSSSSYNATQNNYNPKHRKLSHCSKKM